MTRRCLDAGLSEPEFSVSGGFMATVRRATLAGRNGIRSVVITECQNAPVAKVELLVLFPDRTWKRAITDEEGVAHLELHATHLPMTVLAAREGFRACVSTGWIPDDGSLALELVSLPGGDRSSSTRRSVRCRDSPGGSIRYGTHRTGSTCTRSRYRSAEEYPSLSSSTLAKTCDLPTPTERNGAYASPRSRAAPRWSSIKGDAGVSTLRERGVRTQQVAATSGRQRGNVWERAKPLRD